MIAWLKILLPLGALALLSTIFLLSRSPDPIASIPVLANGIDPSQGEQMGSPFYAGTTDSGRALTLAARQARADGDANGGMIADDLRAVLDIEDGNQITIDAVVGQMGENDRLVLSQGVVLESSSGYTVRSDGLNASINRVDITSTGAVSADGPGVVVTAGQLRVREAAEANDIELLFTNGVKLVYTPQNVEAE